MNPVSEEINNFSVGQSVGLGGEILKNPKEISPTRLSKAHNNCEILHSVLLNRSTKTDIKHFEFN